MQCFCLTFRRWVSFVLCLVMVGSSAVDPPKRGPRCRKYSKNALQFAYGHYFDSTRPNVDAAMQEVLKSLTARPNYPEAHMLAGLIYLGREQYTKAIRHFKRALDIRPTYHAAANNLGTAYWRQVVGMMRFGCMVGWSATSCTPRPVTVRTTLGGRITKRASSRCYTPPLYDGDQSGAATLSGLEQPWDVTDRRATHGPSREIPDACTEVLPQLCRATVSSWSPHGHEE